MRACRTEVLGVNYYACSKCGEITKTYHSCKNTKTQLFVKHAIALKYIYSLFSTLALLGREPKNLTIKSTKTIRYTTKQNKKKQPKNKYTAKNMSNNKKVNNTLL